jgi:hypothetical protein
MTAIGWIVVLGAAGAYALLVFACWRAVKKGPREWTDAEHVLPPGNHGPPISALSNAEKGPCGRCRPKRGSSATNTER